MFVFPPLLMTQDYFDRRNEAKSQLPLSKATVSKVEVVGMGDRVCVDLCSIMRPGEGLLVCVYISLVHCCHALKKNMEILKCSLFSVTSWVYHSALLAPLICGILLIPVIHTSITWHLIFRLDPMQEECSLFTLNAWKRTTLQTGLSGSMR